MINDYRNFVAWEEHKETASANEGHITDINLDQFEKIILILVYEKINMFYMTKYSVLT